MTGKWLAILASATSILAVPALGQAARLEVDGDQVTIARDRYGVPHVFASTVRGLFTGNGYATAQDRLGQMDLYRRSARGEMAGLVGKQAVAADRETRIDGYTEAERQAQFDRMGSELQIMFTCYADGVNRYIQEMKAAGKPIPAANYPAPGGLVASRLRQWTVSDSIAVGQMMARRFGGDEGGELRNMMVFGLVKARYGANAWKLLNDVLWRNDPAAPTTIPAGADGRPAPVRPAWAAPSGKLLASFDPAAAARAEAVLSQRARLDLATRLGLMTRWGSYCAVVSAAKSSSGNALLVGGPQMGFKTPQIAHEMHLSGGGIECIGMGFAGVPGILIGHNGKVAWSTTTGVNDQTDVFVETLDPADPTRYRFKGEWRSMDKHTEVIEVAGGEPVEVEVCRTVHGPVVQWDKAHNLAYSRMSSYRDHELDTFAAIAGFHRSTNVRQFGEACKLVSTSHNWFAADQQGNIGYWFAGRSPIRDPRVDPRLPTPGDGTREWRGMVPAEQMPHLINPPQGFMANWNNKPAAWWDCRDTPAWGEVQHVARIKQLLAARARVSTEDLRNVLLDIGTNDYTAQCLVPLLKRAAAAQSGLLTPAARKAAGRLAAWDCHATEGSVAKTIFDAWLSQVRDRLFLQPFGFIMLQGRGTYETAMQPSYILHVLLGKQSGVPAQFDYLQGKSPDRVMVEALNAAVSGLEKSRGGLQSAWSFSRGYTRFDPLPSMPATDRGTYIQIVECSKPTVTGVNILPPGQSERTDSAHFGDQLGLAGWFFFKPMLTDRAAIEASGAAR